MGESSRCEDPAPTGGIAGYTAPTIILRPTRGCHWVRIANHTVPVVLIGVAIWFVISYFFNTQMIQTA
ncbi:MAG: hypothetical protein ACFNOP_00190, partial [Bacteroides sp.]